MRKTNLIYVIFIITILIILVCLSFILIDKNNNDAKSIEDGTKSDQNIPNSQILDSFETYNYNNDYINPQFSIQYPSNWDNKFCTNSGCWDIELNHGDEKLYIDLSGQGQNTFEQSLDDWITRWGSLNIDYQFEIIEQGTLTNNSRNFIVFKVTEKNSKPYLMAIVDVASMYTGRGHLAVKASAIDNLPIISQILNSIK